jgi:MFS family permease
VNRWLRAALLLFALGATLGTALDAVHVHTATTRYTDPLVFEMAWFVPLLFGGAGVAVGLSRPLFDRLLRRDGPAPGTPALLGGLALFIAAYVLSGTLPAGNVAKCAALGALAAASLLLFDRTGLGLLLACTTAVTGSAIEAAQIEAGIFSYLAPDRWGVPCWLPCLYACAQVAIGNLGRALICPRDR